MYKKVLAIAGLLSLPLSAHAAYFSVSGLIDQSSSYSVTTSGVTLTVDNPGPGALTNFPDSYAGLDFGDARPFVGGTYVLYSFDLSFSHSVLLSAIDNPVTLGSVFFSITGDGVSTSSYLSNPSYPTPLLFKAGERYTFSTSSSGIGIIQGFEASVVPVPAAAWLFGSGMVGLAGLARRRRT
jgi:hypothetical protein